MAKTPKAGIAALRPYYPKELGDGWVDRTMLIFAHPKSVDGVDMETNIVVSRDVMGDSETFKMFIERQMKFMEDEMPQYDYISGRDGEISGIKAHDMRCRWMTEAGRVEQRLIFASLGKGEILAVVVTCEDGQYDSEKETVNAMLSSILSKEKAG